MAHTFVRLAPVALVRTPDNWREIEMWLEGLHSSERAPATIAALMAWNLAAKVTNEQGGVDHGAD